MVCLLCSPRPGVASRRVPALGGGHAPASPSSRPSSSVSPAELFALPFASTPVWVYAAPTRIPHSLGEGAWFACRVVLVRSGQKHNYNQRRRK